MKIKIINFLVCFLSVFVGNFSSTNAQVNDAQSDSIGNGSFCQKKQKEFDSLRINFFKKFDAAKIEKERLEYKHPGKYFEMHLGKRNYFDWEKCFSKREMIGCDHCGVYDIYIEDIIDAEFKFEAIETFNHGSCVSVYYYDDIQRTPK